MALADRLPGRSRLALAALLVSLAAAQTGCTLATRAQVDECRRFSQDVRTENARLKDEVLSLRTQNEEYAERAVEDGKRIAQLDVARRELETSVMAYQDQKNKFEAAFRELRDSIPGAPRTQLSFAEPDDEVRPVKDTPPASPTQPRSRPILRSSTVARADREDEGESDPIDPADEPPPVRPKGREKASGGWMPSRTAPSRLPRDEAEDTLKP